MMIPAGYAYFGSGYNWEPFLIASAITSFVALLMIFATHHPRNKISLGTREAFLLTVVSWVFIIVFAALPFLFDNHPLPFTDAIFEATSALTTTGATIFTHLERIHPSILLWRALLQWLGGIGIIVMALTIFPILRIGGMQLFRAESSDKSEKILPRVSQIAKAILGIQACLTVLFTISLCSAGLNIFDALCHAMAALTTGGLSTSDLSMAAFSNPLAEFIVMLAMFVGSCTLTLFIRMWHGDWRAFVRDPQIRGLCLLIATSAALMSLWRLWHTPEATFIDIIRESFFTALSIISTTGLTVADYSTWGDFILVMVLLLPFIGGCTGSTTGGIKIFRIQVVWTVLKNQIAQLRHPHGVFLPHYNKQVLSDGVVNSVFTFVCLFGITYGLLIVLLGLTGLDVLTNISAAAAAITNTGIGIGPIIGPNGSYSPLPDAAKWVLMGGMLMGRLELMAIFILFSRKFWHH